MTFQKQVAFKNHSLNPGKGMSNQTALGHTFLPILFSERCFRISVCALLECSSLQSACLVLIYPFGDKDNNPLTENCYKYLFCLIAKLVNAIHQS